MSPHLCPLAQVVAAVAPHQQAARASQGAADGSNGLAGSTGQSQSASRGRYDPRNQSSRSCRVSPSAIFPHLSSVLAATLRPTSRASPSQMRLMLPLRSSITVSQSI